MSRRVVRKNKQQSNETNLYDAPDNARDENRFDVVNLTSIGSGNPLPNKKISLKPTDTAIRIDDTDAQLIPKNEFGLIVNSKANVETASLMLSPSSATESATTKQAQALENKNDVLAEKKLNQPAETSPSPLSVGQEQLRTSIASDSSGCKLTHAASTPTNNSSRHISVRGTLPTSLILL